MSTERRRYAFYPGCCGTLEEGRTPSRAALACCEVMGLDVVMLLGWTCCGSPGLLDQCSVASAALSVKNVALAAKAGADIVAICPACVSVMRRGMRLVEQQPGLAEHMTEALAELGLALPARWRVRHLLGLMTEEVGSEKVRQHVARPLTGIPVACYYGCGPADCALAARAEGERGPMEILMDWLGAEVVKWEQPGGCCDRTVHCASGELTISILSDAARAGAECISAACPLCAAALQRAALPTQPQPVFFAQLTAGAFGLPLAEAGLRISKAGKRALVRMRRRRESAVS